MSQEAYNKLADQIEEARWGRGPGISKADIEAIGLSVPETFTAKCGRRLKVFGGWEYTCAFIYEKLTGKEFPRINARGRGFRSQRAGEIAIEALRASE